MVGIMWWCQTLEASPALPHVGVPVCLVAALPTQLACCKLLLTGQNMFKPVCLIIVIAVLFHSLKRTCGRV